MKYLKYFIFNSKHLTTVVIQGIKYFCVWHSMLLGSISNSTKLLRKDYNKYDNFALNIKIDFKPKVDYSIHCKRFVGPFGGFILSFI